LNAAAFTFRTEIVMSEAGNADVQISSETMMPETPLRGGVLERGLLIGGKSVPGDLPLRDRRANDELFAPLTARALA
jgi:hypothetical protein